MNIVKLTAENIKKLKAVQITPDGNVVLLTGKNGAGKSSVLDSIVYALCGGKDLPQMPIREGQSKGRVELDLGEVTVKRTFTEKNSYLEVKNKDGFKATSPQALLDEIVGKISFDPLAFVNETRQNQRTILLNLVGINLDDYNNKIYALKNDRSAINHERNKLKIELEKCPVVNAPKEEVSIANLTNELQKAHDHNQKIRVSRQMEGDLLNEIATINDLIGEHQKKISELAKQLTDKENTLQTIQTELKGTEPIDTAAISDCINTAEMSNKLFVQAKRRQALVDAQAEQDKAYKSKGKKIEKIEAEKVKELQSVEMPIEGLSVGDDCVYYNGIPIDQIAASEKLRVGVAVSMALNPRLKVLRITDGSLLDSENLEAISTMVKDKDYQLWLEKVDESGQVGIVIEDGMIVNDKAVNSPA